MKQHKASWPLILKHALVHAAAAWLIINLADSLRFIFMVGQGMIEFRNPDGSLYTLKDRLIAHNFRDPEWLLVIVLAIIIELNYRRVFQRKSLKMFIAMSLVSTVVCYLLIVGVLVWKVHSSPADRFLPTIGWMSADPFSTIGFFFLYITLYAIARDYIHTRAHKAEQRLRHSQAELATLKAQMHPHFFFNTLNNIYGTALQEDAPRTAQYIERLSGLMRYLVREAQSTAVPITHELRFIEEYLALQQLRVPATTPVRQHIAYDGAPSQIAPLLLIPFIENAFLYGVSTDHESDIDLSLTVKEQSLRMNLSNRLLPARSSTGLGTGISNVRRQLELIYPGRHALAITEADGRFVVDLHVELHPVKS